MERSETVAVSGARKRLLQILIAGTNLCVVGVAYPWFFIEQPTLVQSGIHALPWVLLLSATAVLAVTRETLRVRAYVRLGLAIGLPLTVGVAAIARGEAVNLEAMPGWVLLLCVVSLWVFVGVLSDADAETSPAAEPTSPQVRTPTTPERRSPTQLLTIAAALATVTLAPRWLSHVEQRSAWGDALSAGSLLTAAVALATGVGMLLIMLGPAALTKHPPILAPLRQRLWPSLLLAFVSAVVYATIK